MYHQSSQRPAQYARTYYDGLINNGSRDIRGGVDSASTPMTSGNSVENSQHVPVMFCESRDHCAHIRSCIRSKIYLRDGHHLRQQRPAKKAHTIAAYVASNPLPHVATYVIETSVTDPGWIVITKSSTIAPPVPLPADYAQAGIGDIGFLSTSIRLGSLVAISGIVNAAYSNTNTFNKWWYVAGVSLTNVVGGEGSSWTLAPYPLTGLRVGDFLQARSYANDVLGPAGPMVLRITNINMAWCSWVLEPTGVSVVIRFQRVHLRACIRTCHKGCRRESTGCCDLMCRLPQLRTVVRAAPRPYKDETYDLSHIKPYRPPASRSALPAAQSAASIVLEPSSELPVQLGGTSTVMQGPMKITELVSNLMPQSSGTIADLATGLLTSPLDDRPRRGKSNKKHRPREPAKNEMPPSSTSHRQVHRAQASSPSAGFGGGRFDALLGNMGEIFQGNAPSKRSNKKH